jgi:hypothetical protein
MINLTIMVMKNQFDKKNTDTQPYLRVFPELKLSDDGLILRDNRLVTPSSLQDDIIKIAHEGHLVNIKTKQLIRSKIWFPNKDTVICML